MNINNLNYKIFFESQLNEIITNNSIEPEVFYNLKNFKNQISSGRTEFHFDETHYCVKLFDQDGNIKDQFITSYKKKATEKINNFSVIAKQINGSVTCDETPAHIGDIYILGEIYSCQMPLPKKTYNKNLLDQLHIAYVISDPDMGEQFKFESFSTCVSSIITYMHYTLIEE